MSYVQETDLLLGELTSSLPSSISVTQYLDMTAEEMDAKLGVLYKVPIAINGLPNSQGGLIRSIHRKLASGRIIMAATVAHSESSLHAYALQLVKEALMELMAVANGDVVLVGAERVNGDGTGRGEIDDAEILDPQARVPGSKNRDTYSAVEAFEFNFMIPETFGLPIVGWAPGER